MDQIRIKNKILFIQKKEKNTHTHPLLLNNFSVAFRIPTIYLAMSTLGKSTYSSNRKKTS